MPHAIDFDGIERKLFALQHICYGSRQFCETIGVGRLGDDVAYDEWINYSSLVKLIISNTVIEAAIKIRMLQDFIKADDQKVNLPSLDAEARKNLAIGKFIQGKYDLTLRETCNKIVHATEARLQWNNIEVEGSNEYWNGLYDLWGTYKGKQWQVELKVEAWCIAMIRFNNAIQESVDWWHVYKYDE